MTPENLTHLILTYRYWILIPLSFVEGPIIAFITGTLAWLGYFNPYVAFSVFFCRDVILDGFFYYVGWFSRDWAITRRIFKKLKVDETHIAEIRALWDHHGFKTMFFSKLSYGMSASFLAVAGMVKMPYVRFFYLAALVALAQYGVLFILGYFFGSALGAVTNVLNIIQYIVAGALLVATGYYIFTRFMRRRLIEQEEEVEAELHH